MNYIGNTTHHLKKSLQKLKKNTHLTSAFSQRLRKYTFTAVHTKTHKRRFQIYPLWRAFSNLCVYGERFHRLRVDGRPKRIKKFAFTSVCVYNRLRVDGVLERKKEKTKQQQRNLAIICLVCGFHLAYCCVSQCFLERENNFEFILLVLFLSERFFVCFFVTKFSSICVSLSSSISPDRQPVSVSHVFQDSNNSLFVIS